MFFNLILGYVKLNLGLPRRVRKGVRLETPAGNINRLGYEVMMSLYKKYMWNVKNQHVKMDVRTF